MPEQLQLPASSLALSLLLVLSALIILWLERIRLEKDIGVGVARCFVQVLALGYAVDYIFAIDRPLAVLALLGAMLLVGAHTARGRLQGGGAGAFLLCLTGLALAALFSLGLVFVLGMLPFETRYVIPTGGIVIGNATRTLSVALDRLGGEFHARRAEIEVALSLGDSPRGASHPARLAAVRAALIPSIDGMKIIGLVQMPGAMLGMLLGGADPLDAARLQILVVYLLLASNTAAASYAVHTAARCRFTPAWQLREPT